LRLEQRSGAEGKLMEVERTKTKGKKLPCSLSPQRPPVYLQINTGVGVYDLMLPLLALRAV